MKVRDGHCLSYLHSHLKQSEYTNTRFQAEDRDMEDHKAVFRQPRHKLLDRMLENLRARFPKVDILDAMKVSKLIRVRLL